MFDLEIVFRQSKAKSTIWSDFFILKHKFYAIRSEICLLYNISWNWHSKNLVFILFSKIYNLLACSQNHRHRTWHTPPVILLSWQWLTSFISLVCSRFVTWVVWSCNCTLHSLAKVKPKGLWSLISLGLALGGQVPIYTPG